MDIVNKLINYFCQISNQKDIENEDDDEFPEFGWNKYPHKIIITNRDSYHYNGNNADDIIQDAVMKNGSKKMKRMYKKLRKLGYSDNDVIRMSINYKEAKDEWNSKKL